jgi:murein DD-endopeptidase MepM/ murein hydrolase activator NlpD/predicted chitinase
MHDFINPWKYHKAVNESSTSSSHLVGNNKFTWGGGPDAHGKRAFGNWESDNAWDVMARAGTPVYSIFDGKVKSVKLANSSNQKVYGWHVTVFASEFNEKVFYTHLGSLEPSIKKGYQIKKGELIGHIGRPSDGRVWYEHVHIGLKNKDLKNYVDESGNILGAPKISPEESESESGSSEGRFNYPLATEATLTSKFGPRWGRMHKGIDLGIPTGAGVVSIADGTVEKADMSDKYGYGNLILIRHDLDGETLYSAYAHLSQMDVQVGDRVKKGQIIGKSGGDQGVDGGAGNSRGAHLHFEIRKSQNGDHVDPLPYLSGAGRDVSSASSEGGTLKYGSESEDVRRMQQSLVDKGYDLPVYGVDGLFYGETQATLMKFQKDKGLPETGTLDDKTEEELYSGSGFTKKRRNFIKLYDKENKKMIIVKRKFMNSDTYNVYDKDKKQTGEFVKKGDRVISVIEKEEKDITDTEVGRIMLRLFALKDEEIADSGNVDSGDIQIEITGPSRIKHTYSGEQAKNIRIIEEVAKQAGITNTKSLIGLLCVIGKESGFIPQREISYSTTSNSRIRSIFGARVAKYDDSELTALKNNEEEFWDAVYGKEATPYLWPNTGNTQKGDGWKYRGRGFNGITFKSLYAQYGKAVGADLVSNPDLANNPVIAAKIAVAMLVPQLKQKGIDPNGFESIDDAIYNFARANAGWASDPTWAVSAANGIRPNFSEEYA